MQFPAFFLIIAGMVILLITIGVVYYRIYKRKINLALAGSGTQGKPMPAPFDMAALLIIVFLLFAVLMSFVLGFRMGYHALDNDEGQIDIHAFYAEVKEVGTETITVKGLQLNDADYRSEFTFQLYEGLMIERHNQPISLSDIDKGDLVSIVLLTDISGVEDVFKIQLIDEG